jgi:hypothetical protein
MVRLEAAPNGACGSLQATVLQRGRPVPGLVVPCRRLCYREAAPSRGLWFFAGDCATERAPLSRGFRFYNIRLGYREDSPLTEAFGLMGYIHGTEKFSQIRNQFLFTLTFEHFVFHCALSVRAPYINNNKLTAITAMPATTP